MSVVWFSFITIEKNNKKIIAFGKKHISFWKKKNYSTLVKGDLKTPFSIATTPMCRGGHYSISWIAPF